MDPMWNNSGAHQQTLHHNGNGHTGHGMTEGLPPPVHLHGMDLGGDFTGMFSGDDPFSEDWKEGAWQQGDEEGDEVDMAAVLGKRLLKPAEAIDTLAREGKCLSYDDATGVYTVLDGDLFVQEFTAMRINRDRKNEDNPNRPFASMYRQFVIVKGKSWTTTGTAFKRKGKEGKKEKVENSSREKEQASPSANSHEDDSLSSQYPSGDIAASSVIVAVQGPGGGQEQCSLQHFVEVTKIDELFRLNASHATGASGGAGQAERKATGLDWILANSGWQMRQEVPDYTRINESLRGTEGNGDTRRKAWREAMGAEDVHAVVGGLWNAQSKGDQAYFFFRAEGVTAQRNGAIVELVDGRLVAGGEGGTGGVWMVVSDANAKWKGEPHPSPAEEARGHWCCFLGQVPVVVRGAVETGELIAHAGGGEGAVAGEGGEGVVGIALQDKVSEEAEEIKVLCFAGLGALGAAREGGAAAYRALAARHAAAAARVKAVEEEVDRVRVDVGEAGEDAQEAEEGLKEAEGRVEKMEEQVSAWRQAAWRNRAMLGLVAVLLAVGVALMAVYIPRSQRSVRAVGAAAPPAPPPPQPTRKKVLLVACSGLYGDLFSPTTTPYLHRLASQAPPPTSSRLSVASPLQAGRGPSWAAILTGVGSAKHQVRGDDFGAWASVSFPPLTARLPYNFVTASVGRWREVNDNLVGEVAVVEMLESDGEVTLRGVELLEGRDGAEEAEGGEEVGEGVDVLLVGLEGKGGDDAEAARDLDEKVAALHGAVLQRAGWEGEDWLTVVAAVSEDRSVAAAGLQVPRGRAGLVLLNAVNLEPAEPEDEARGWEQEAGERQPLLTTAAAHGTVAAAGAMDFGAQASFTVEALVQVLAAWEGDPSIVSNKDWSQGENAGWVLALHGNGASWKVNIADGVNRVDLDGSDVNDGLWHHVAMVVDRQAGEVRLFEDGVVAAVKALGPVGSAEGGLPVLVGQDGSGSYEFAADGVRVDALRVWGEARSGEQLRDGACRSVAGEEAGRLWFDLERDGEAQGLGPLKAGLADAREGEADLWAREAVCNARVQVQEVDVAATVLCHLGALEPAWELDGRCLLKFAHPGDCFDNIRNGGEPGVDCGGNCSMWCGDPTCTDGVQNQGEEGVDCGGPCTHCQCIDGVRNGDEEDVDCGGSLCPSCCQRSSQCTGKQGLNYKGCVNVTLTGIPCQRWDARAPHAHGHRPEDHAPGYLVSNYCRNPNNNPHGPWCHTEQWGQTWGYCSSDCNFGSSCFDGIQNGDELGVDCGGGCLPCAQPPSCFDELHNQGEEGLDCGGPCKPCNATGNCSDGILNRDEDDVDCGGSHCAPCCNASSACTSGLGLEYRGCANVGWGNLTCQRWDSHLYHRHSYVSRDLQPNAGLDSNYCRNPDNEPQGPWCYTTNPLVRWVYCDVGCPRT